MPFIPVQQERSYFGDGEKSSKICIVGESMSKWEIRSGRVFSGPVGTIYEQCLHGANLTRADVYATNIVKIEAKFTLYYREKKGFTDLGKEAVNALKKEISELDCNIVIAMGEAATFALTGRMDVTKCRGYIFPCVFNPLLKVIPTIHPAKVQFGDYIARHYISHDMNKAKEHSSYKGLKYDLTKVEIARTYLDAVTWLEEIATWKHVSIDIEVINYECSCIGFGKSIDTSIVIPFYGKDLYTLEQEINLWRLVAIIMYDENIAKTGQNFIFDMQFLLARNRIVTRGTIYDTMIRHSIAYPEFLKSLAFLTSIYCNRPYWKDMVSWKKKDQIKNDA
ncbi:MAG: hypothetical protein COA94_04835 [Rickettsiales bacterium]|nr:MAG: hypothetical protein COA94_04835 [Rickettsiales bacterium]